VYFWEKPVEFLNEIYRVLKDDGTFVLTFGQRFHGKTPFTAYDFTLYNNDEMESWFLKAILKE
jgi:ubiquinone/menaquinone biosynthesis C-methylase UbiE